MSGSSSVPINSRSSRISGQSTAFKDGLQIGKDNDEDDRRARKTDLVVDCTLFINIPFPDKLPYAFVQHSERVVWAVFHNTLQKPRHCDVQAGRSLAFFIVTSAVEKSTRAWTYLGSKPAFRWLARYPGLPMHTTALKLASVWPGVLFAVDQCEDRIEGQSGVAACDDLTDSHTVVHGGSG